MAIRERYASAAGGGAHDGSSEANAWSFAEMLTAASTGTPAAGDRINFKGDHSLAASATFDYAGTATAPVIIRGYSSTIGDLSSRTRTNGNGALSTTGVPVWACGATYQVTLPTWCVLQDIALSGSRNDSVLILGAQGVVLRCSITTTGTGASAGCVSGASYTALVDCDFTHAGASGGRAAVHYGSSGSWIVGCRIDGGPTHGINAGTGQAIIGCTVYSAGGDAILINTASNNLLLVGNTLVGAASDGIHQITGPTRLTTVVNNLITDNGAYGIYSVDAGAGIFAVNNRLRRNNSDDGVDPLTEDQTSGATDWLAAFAGLNYTTAATQANEYEAAGSDDYRLKSTSPALSIGIPLYGDLGALQRIRDYPAVGNVTEDDTVDGATGTYHEAAVGEVQSGVQFGAGGTEYTGTYAGGGGSNVGAYRTTSIGIGV